MSGKVQSPVLRVLTMSEATLEERVTALEAQVAQWTAPWLKPQQPKDWRRSIGILPADELTDRIFAEAMRLRQEDRERFYREFDQQQAESP